jgi:hypothetical protein
MTRVLQTVLDEANQNKLHTALQMLPVGRAMNLVPKFFRGTVVADVLVLPTGAKAHAILAVTATIGTVTGHFTPVVGTAAPATTQANVNAVGNIAFANADAVTEAEVTYVTIDGETVTRQIVVVAGTGIGVLPPGDVGVTLMSATVDVGGALGAKTVLPRTGAAPAAGNARLDINGDQIRFAIADAVTLATVTFVRTPTLTIDASLRSAVSY